MGTVSPRTTASRVPPGERLRVGVVGLGHFAQTAVLPAFAQLKDVTLAALISGNDHKLETLGDRYGVEHRVRYDQLESLIGPVIDAVYVVVPNDLHADLAVRAALAGAHVLCEKPMAPTEEECLAMIRAASASGVQLMIGYRLHFEASNLSAIETVRSGAIGDPRVFSSVFSMQVREGNTRVQARAGAGPLYDIGIYCINAARYLFEEEPVEVTALAQATPEDPRFSDVEEAVSAILTFPSGRVATFVVSFGAAHRASYDVIGTDGHLTLENSYENTGDMTLRVVTKKGAKSRRFARRDQVAAELSYFAQCMRDGVAPEPGGWEGLADVRIINAILESIHCGRSVAIVPVEPQRRPAPAQAIRVAPHGEPRLVDVEQPTTK